MTSENKKRKEKNRFHSVHGWALKERWSRLKRFLYYNSSQRQENKKITENDY